MLTFTSIYNNFSFHAYIYFIYDNNFCRNLHLFIFYLKMCWSAYFMLTFKQHCSSLKLSKCLWKHCLHKKKQSYSSGLRISSHVKQLQISLQNSHWHSYKLFTRVINSFHFFKKTFINDFYFEMMIKKEHAMIHVAVDSVV